jgi:hypothetical protein
MGHAPEKKVPRYGISQIMPARTRHRFASVSACLVCAPSSRPYQLSEVPEPFLSLF